MSRNVDLAPLAAGMVFIWLVLVLPTALLLSRRLLGAEITAAWSRAKRTGFILLAWAMGGVAIVQRIFELPGHIPIPFPYSTSDADLADIRFTFALVTEMLSRGLALMLAVLLGLKLYEKWINRRLSDAEQSTDTGVALRAWMGGWNLVVALLIALCAWQGYDASFWFVLIVTMGALAAYPLMKLVTEPRPLPVIPVAPPVESLSPERERVLRLLEQGKITAEESAELLAALAATVPPPPPPPPLQPAVEPMTPTRKLMLAGAALVLIGFFLPWFKINPAAEAQKAMAAMQQAMGGAMPYASSGMPNFNMKVNGVDVTPSTAAGEISITGGEIGRGLGWIILVLALGAASSPYIVTAVHRQLRWKGMLAAVAIALIVAVYLITQSPSAVSIGLPVVVIGLVLEGVALVREREPAARHGFPVVAPLAV